MKKIPLQNGKFALVDNDFYPWLKRFNWFIGGTYAVRHDPQNWKKHIYMHKEIMPCTKNKEVDHINHNRLDNRLENLRICTRFQNAGNTRERSNNTSGYKGVYWQKNNRKWIASIHVNGKCTYLGSFKDKEKAALAFNKSAKDIYKEFAYTNKL